MTKKRLLEGNIAWPQECIDLSREVKDALWPVLNRWVEAGYSTIDIEHVVTGEISLHLGSIRILEGLNNVKKNYGNGISVDTDTESS